MQTEFFQNIHFQQISLKAVTMGYIKFDKKQLVNLEYSLSKELLRTNRAGAFGSTTIINCNTRKYHGLLIVPQPQFGNSPHVLLSTFDETVIQREAEFNLGIHKYENNNYSPKGHKYIRDFELDPHPKITYRVGGVVLEKELLFSSNENRVLFKYTLVEAHSPTILRFRPFLAYRNIHALSKANIDANKKFEQINHGIRLCMYDGYSSLFIQFSKEAEYTHVPDWYFNIEYSNEKDRGYDYFEDLYVPGFFDLPVKKGESIFCSIGTTETNPQSIKRKFSNEIKKRIIRDSFENCLINAAGQFIVKKNSKTEIIAGYPWFGKIGRDTFISLPGLTLSRNDLKTFRFVIDSMISEMNGPFFPNVVLAENVEYNSVDTGLWFFWALQKYAELTGDYVKIWRKYGKVLKLILDAYSEGTWFNIGMHDNGLLYAGEAGNALTWMNAFVNGKPVTPRIGFPVEVNALWYNAVVFCLELAEKANDKIFTEKWKDLPDKIKKSFTNTFWDDEKLYLADYVNGNFKDRSVRPNMIFAVSLPYSPLTILQQKKVLDVVKSELLTPRGLRTLSPKNEKYKGIYKGDQAHRDEAYHQGTVFPWLLGHFAESYLKLHGKGGLQLVKNLYSQFEPEMQEYCLGSVPELYDGDPPHFPGGAISQAASVAELLRIKRMILTMENKK